MKDTYDAEEFVSLWLGSATLAEVATKLGKSKPAVAMFANRLRRLGVNLPKFKTGVSTSDVNVKALNALISKAVR